MYVSLIITIVLLLVIVITGIQNSMPLGIKFIIWDIQMSITALIFYSSIIGGAIIAILTLPRLVKKSLQLRSLNREINKLKENMALINKEQAGKIEKVQIPQEM
ncbi:MAG: DUF1049 domain-containing protein [Deltaproteobacteria bacterium]|nr:DUF1049 domain-containing protein [Deltaproteobacteria bacterium]